MLMMSIKSRVRILLIAILVITIGLIIRVVYLSSLPVEDYQLVNQNYTVRRGDIIDRNQRILAVSDRLKSVYAIPGEVKKAEATAFHLAPLLDMSAVEITQKINEHDNFIWLKRQIPQALAQKIAEKKLRGIYLTDDFKRIYPNQHLASHIMGFCNQDGKGLEGIERTMDDYLLKDEISDFDQKRGHVIQLTIDANIQAIAEQNLRNAFFREKAEAASLILVDGKNGEILAMANYPDFNPNHYRDYAQKDYRNISIFNQYEPGSVIKIFTLAALLQHKSISFDEQFFCDGGYDQGQFHVNCTGVHGQIGISGIFKYSCNDSTLQAAAHIQAEDFYYYLKAFGFGEKTNIRLPGEQAGTLRKVEDWSGRSMLSVPIGQEISVNSLQIVQAATTFVNQGKILNVHLIKNIYNQNNEALEYLKGFPIRQVVEPEISAFILSAMTESTTSGGTVDELNVPGISFAAKSGTGEIFDLSLGQYSETDFSSSLLIIFPYENPRYIAYTVFHKPKGETKWGGIMGAHLMNDFLSDLTGYLDIYAPNVLINEEKNYLNQEYEKINQLPAVIPDLTGLTAGDVIDIFSRTSIQIKVHGQGIVEKQTPGPGQIIDENSTIKIYLKPISFQP